MNARSLFAEALGTALLVFLAVGTATLSFGFKVTGASNSAGVVATAVAFGLVLVALVYGIGAVSGCHINPAVTLGFLVGRRIQVRDAVGYWAAQVAGGIIGAAGLYGVFHLSSAWHKSVGLGADGFGKASMIGASAGAALIAEVVLTFLFVFVILAVTRRSGNALVAGLVIGLALTLVHLMGIPIDGTSVNPARSIGPALFVGGTALSQLWVFIVGPLAGGALAAGVYQVLYPEGEEEASVEPAPEETVR
ncbi:MAG TPA: aquaporin [Acidimicrobiales bacterium]|nr:aquaporin [Acidimicrobiales bacterium]